MAFKLGDRFGLGVGLIVRASEVELDHHLPLLNPSSTLVEDGGTAVLTSDLETGFGGQIGVQHRVNNYFRGAHDNAEQ